jgi:hypothetical protein
VIWCKGNDGVSITNCTIFEWSGDALDIVNCDNTLVDNNLFYNVMTNPASSHHYDNIQIWYSDGSCNNLTITNNVFDVGDMRYAQNFITSHVGAGSHTNLVYENNIHYTAHTNAVRVVGWNGATVRFNTIIRKASNPNWPENPPGPNSPKIHVSDSSNVTVEQNVFPIAVDDESGSTVSNNLLLLDSDYATEFDNGTTSYVAGLSNWVALAGEEIDSASPVVGAPRTRVGGDGGAGAGSGGEVVDPPDPPTDPKPERPEMIGGTSNTLFGGSGLPLMG